MAPVESVIDTIQNASSSSFFLSGIDNFITTNFYALFIAAFACTLAWIFTIHKTSKNSKTIGPNPFFFTTNYLRFNQEFFAFLKRHNILDKVEMTNFWAGTRFCVLATSPAASKFVLNNSDGFEKTMKGITTIKVINERFGTNIISTEGEYWKKLHALFSPSFSLLSLKSFYPIFREVTEKFITKLKVHTDKEFDLFPHVNFFVLDLLMKALFGYDFKALDGETKDYEAYRAMVSYFPNGWYRMFPWLEYIPFIPSTKRLFACVNHMDDLFKKLVSQCKLERSRPTIFSQVFKDESAALLSEKELVANAFIFFIAGHDSTGTALGWGLTMLAECPDVQEKIYEEITKVLGPREPEFDDLKDLIYLDCFIKEVLRFHPPAVLALSRLATKDVTYKNHTIPKGSIAGVNIYAVHHSESLWKDADTFNPDRFLTKDYIPYSYIPFSLGTRPCIGKFFSLLEQRLFYVRLLQEYKIIKASDFAPRERTKTMLLTGPENVRVTLIKRNS